MSILSLLRFLVYIPSGATPFGFPFSPESTKGERGRERERVNPYQLIYKWPRNVFSFLFRYGALFFNAFLVCHTTDPAVLVITCQNALHILSRGIGEREKNRTLKK
jgi:hypothetical protein